MLHKTLFVARNRMCSFSIDEELNRYVPPVSSEVRDTCSPLVVPSGSPGEEANEPVASCSSGMSPSAAQIRLARVWTYEVPIGQAEFTVIIPLRQIDSFANL